MIRIQEVVENIVKNTPFLEEGLNEGIINYTGLARHLQPIIQKHLIKNVQKGAIIMALRRIEKEKYRKKDIRNSIIDITVRSNLKIYTYLNSGTIIKKYSKIHEIISIGIFCNISQSIRETTIIFSQELTSQVENLMQEETLIKKIHNASSITLRLTEETTQTSGAYYTLLKLLAWENINILEIVSTYQELTLVCNQKDINKAYIILSQYANP